MSARMMVFIDYWNFQLRLNQLEGRRLGQDDVRFKIDWRKLGPLLAKKAGETMQIEDHAFEGCMVYTSFNPGTEDGLKFRQWAVSWLGRQPGMTVHCRERKPKTLPRCPNCYRDIPVCPSCKKDIKATIEKGVDTLLATDMIRLAWEDAYDVAVLATSDADLIPAVEFLRHKARKVIQAGFPPAGADLATACWASFDVFRSREELARA